MNIIKRFKCRAAIKKASAGFDMTPEQARKELEQLIDFTWQSEDPGAKAFQKQLFPDGQPSPEELIFVLSDIVKNNTANRPTPNRPKIGSFKPFYPPITKP